MDRRRSSGSARRRSSAHLKAHGCKFKVHVSRGRKLKSGKHAVHRHGARCHAAAPGTTDVRCKRSSSGRCVLSKVGKAVRILSRGPRKGKAVKVIRSSPRRLRIMAKAREALARMRAMNM
jgi:hypothetical protein